MSEDSAMTADELATIRERFEAGTLTKRDVAALIKLAETVVRPLGRRGMVGYGWRRDGGEVVEVPEQQQVIARIKAMRETTPAPSYRAVAAKLNLDGVPGPTGGPWSGEAVRRATSR